MTPYVAAGVISVDTLPQIISELCHVDIPPDMFQAFKTNLLGAASSPPGIQPLALADDGDAPEASNAIVPHDSRAKRAAKVKFEERLAYHEASDRETLLSAVVSAEMNLDANRKEVYRVAKSRDYYKNRCDHIAVLYDGKQDELDSLKEQTCFRPGARNISKYGGYTLAIQASASAASTSDTLQLVAGLGPAGKFKDRSIVTKYTQRLFAAVRLKSKEAYTEMFSLVATGPVGGVDGPPQVMPRAYL